MTTNPGTPALVAQAFEHAGLPADADLRRTPGQSEPDADPVGDVCLPGRPARGLRSLALSGYTLGLGALGAVIAGSGTDTGPFTTISMPMM